MVNAKRRRSSELASLHTDWDVTSNVPTEEDEFFDPAELESDESVRRRANAALKWVWEREESAIAVVAHGGLFHKLIHQNDKVRAEKAPLRFQNCQLEECSFRYIQEEDVFELRFDV